MVKIIHTSKAFLFLMVIFLYLTGLPTMACAGTMEDYDTEESNSMKLKIASGGLTFLYLPIKATYAGLGGIVGGIAYIFGGGDEEMGEVVWTPTIKGNYIITPAHLRGEKPVQFFGQEESEPSQLRLGRGARLKRPSAP